ncbi:MAG: hypothetical protein JXA71_07000 [Chitinispirillaceae bacterium]|nr:hypothetical protein [Chitinispirillaceae bacterium]
MKNLIILLAVLLLAAAGIFTVIKVRNAASAASASAAETKGDFSKAASDYADALLKIIPSIPVPDINESKVISQAGWKKKMEDYAAWLSGSSSQNAEIAKRSELLGGILRNEARIHTAKFLTRDSMTTLTPEQYATLWNSAFFGRGVTPDPAHASLAASCHSKGFSIVRFSALTSYQYQISLIDTVKNRRTIFTVPPEDRTFILAPPGDYLLLCRSSIRYPGRKIWHSAPVIIPLSVPPVASLITRQIETQVVRDIEAQSVQ